MRIGIDIDGVLIDSETYELDYGIKFCMENNLTYKIKLDEYEGNKKLGISKENEKIFWEKYLKYYVQNSKPRDFAVEIIKKLKEEGNEIYIITARNEWGLSVGDYGRMREFTEEWLNKNEIYYDKIIYTEGDKLPYALGNYIDIVVEDSSNNIKSISTKIPVLCYHCYHNADIEGKNITRVYSWHDIYNKIKNN